MCLAIEIVCHNVNRNRHNVYVYKFIRNSGGLNKMINELLYVALLNILEQRKLKRHYIETLKASLNTYLPTRTETRDVFYL